MTTVDRIIAWGDKTTLGIVYKAGPCPMDGMALFPPTKYVRADLVDALAAALKPIAAEADAWEGCDAIDRIVESLGGYSGEMTVGDLRRAAAALAAWEARK